MVESVWYDRLLTEDIRFGQGSREVRLQNSRVVTMQDFDPGWEIAYRTGQLPDYVGKGRSIMVSRPTAVTSAITIPRNETLIIPDGGSLDLRAVVTCYGRIVAGHSRIFTGTGSITFPDGGTVQAEWWGAKGDGVTDCAPALQLALNASTLRMEVLLGEGTFVLGSKVTAPLDIERDWRLMGRGLRKSILQRASGYSGTLLEIGALAGNNGRFIVDGVGFDGLDAAAGTVGIRILRAGSGQISNCLVKLCEHGIWQTAGVSNVIRDTRVEDCGYAITLDNGANTPTMFAVQDSSLRNNTIVGILIDGSTNASGLLRNIQLDRVTFESDTVATGTEIGLKIRVAQQINVRNCWFESGSRFVDIDGGEANRPTALIKFDTCNFGRQNDNAANAIAFLFNGTGGNDGLGCEITNCGVVTSGPFATAEYEFNQENWMTIRNTYFLGDSVPTGSSWQQVRTTDSEGEEYSELASKTNWRPWRLLKNDGVVQSRALPVFNTGRTTNATTTTLGELVVTAGSSVVISARVVAKTTDNANQAAYHVVGLFTATVPVAPADQVVAQVGATTVEHVAIESAGAAAWTFDLDAIGGTTVRYRATGAAATTIDWFVWITSMQLTPP